MAAVGREQGTRRRHLLEAVWNERLCAKPRVYGHDQDEIEVADDVANLVDRRRRIQRDTRRRAELAYRMKRPVQMRSHLNVDRDHGGAGADERLEVPIGAPIERLGTKCPSITST